MDRQALIKEQERVLESKDAHAAFLFAYEHQYTGAIDVPALQEIVLKFGSGSDAYAFAKDVKLADISKLMDVVVERDTSDGHYPYLFARDIAFQDNQPICDYLITLKNPKYALLMARDVADYLLDEEFRAFQDIIINMGSGRDIINFAMQVADTDLESLEDVLHRKGTVNEIIEFINCIEDADVSRAEKALIARHDPHIDTFILQAEGASLSSIFNTVLISNNCADAIWLASVRLSQSIDRDQLQKVVIEHGTAEDIYDYMKNVPSANIVSLRDRLVEMYNDGHDHGILAKFDADTRSSISAVTAKRNTMKTG